VACLDDDFEAPIAHLRFPLGHRRAICTTNLLERLFGEERRRTKMIPHAFGERAVLKLMYAALIRAAERWRGIKISGFAQRQLKAIRGDSMTRSRRPTPQGSVPGSPLPQPVYPATIGLDPGWSR
jgi:transposase-like protein